MTKYEKGIEKIYHFDLYEGALNSNINAAESGNEISSEQAWYLREKHLGIYREDLLWKD